jgi:hypothetical protein
MKGGSANRDIPGPAKRGHVVQRVIVDGWTIGEAARAAGLDERTVARWVADYRRRGMASLREDRSRRRLRQRLILFLQALRRGVAHRRGAAAATPSDGASPRPLRRSRDDRR